jgi:NAD-dependent oxidoreductase involved in siderophore biosynthesis
MGNAYRKWQRQENRTDKAIAEKPLHESFLENVKRYQDKTALVWNDEKNPNYISLENDWVSSIAIDLEKLKSMIDDRRALMSKAQQEQKYARIWNNLLKQFGYPLLNEALEQSPILVFDLKQEALLPEERK